MKRHIAGHPAEPGIYFSLRHLSFRAMDEEARLPGEDGEAYVRLPAAAMLVVGPLMGLAYVIFLPLIGIAMLGWMGAGRLARLAGRTLPDPARMLRPVRARSQEATPPVNHATLTRSTRIHAPFSTTYALARDPEHWTDWYVGLGTPTKLSPSADRTFAVGMGFPLAGHVLDEHREPTRAHWRSRMEGPAEMSRSGRNCRALMLGGTQDWTYEAVGGETQVTVEVDCNLPAPDLAEAAPDVVAKLEGDCIQRSLNNLRELCETVH